MSVSAAPEQMCQPKSMNFVRKMYVGTRIPSVEPHGLARGFSQWCGQRFVQDEEVEEYATPQTINGNCFNCGADVVIHVSKYNGHKSYHCNKCGCSIMG